ncbi:MAG: hypothetical protein H5T97_14305 [Firmicutes bacterium]|nr:hypothetical protein [Bacillota bacterium]
MLARQACGLLRPRMVKILKVLRDEFAQNPREFDNFGKMVCWHPEHHLGDSHSFATPQDFDRWAKKYVRQDRIVMLPLHFRDRDGQLAISTVPFDPREPSHVGWIYATKEDLRREFGVKRLTGRIKHRAVDVLQKEVETYNHYLSGRVFGFDAFEIDAGKVREMATCWGFYGGDVGTNGMLEYVPTVFKNLLKSLGHVCGGEILLIDGRQKRTFRSVGEFRDYAAMTPLQNLIRLHAALDFIFRAA